VSDEGTAKPIAVSSVHLSEDDRRRIAAELGLTEDQYEAVPEKLDIARYAEEDIGGDVGSFLGSQMGSPDLSQEIALSDASTFQRIGTTQLSAARISGSLLIPV
jgi:hypothetical protein